MITELSKLLSRVSTAVKAEDLLLQKGAWVYFSPSWPGTWKWCSGKAFRVSEEPVVVKYSKSYILPGKDYRNLDLSNSTAGLKLYPEQEGVLYQCVLGFKKGDYITNIYVPSSSSYIYALGEATMFPQVSDADKRYLGAKEPEDSPHDAPLLSLYFIKDGPAFYLQPYVLESVTFDKVTMQFNINKCKLDEIGVTEDVLLKALRVSYYNELTGF